MGTHVVPIFCPSKGVAELRVGPLTCRLARILTPDYSARAAAITSCAARPPGWTNPHILAQ